MQRQGLLRQERPPESEPGKKRRNFASASAWNRRVLKSFPLGVDNYSSQPGCWNLGYGEVGGRLVVASVLSDRIGCGLRY